MNMLDSSLSDTARHAEQPDSLIQEIESLEQELDSLTRQVARDFEELTLLQSLAGSLELRGETPDPIALVKDFLPRLPVSIMCEAVALIPNLDVLDHASSDQPCTLWSGDVPVLDDEVCRSIAERFGAAAALRPVVINRPRDLDLDERIRDLLLIEVRLARGSAGWLLALNHKRPMGPVPHWIQDGFTTVEANLLTTAGSILATQLHNMRLLRQKEKLFTDVVRAMVNAVEARDRYTCGHSERVALFARELAREAGSSDAECERIYLSGLLHDIGKIAIPDAVLQKPGALEPEERQIIETHTDAGWRILEPLSDLGEVLPGVLYHHEKYDGTGYPDGLSGQRIPWDGRVLAICDAYDAMTSDRPYRDGMPQKKAEAILRAGAGTHWDPTLVEHFFAAMPTMIKIRNTYNLREPASRKR